MLNNSEIFVLLQMLKKSRDKVCGDFLEENPDIYGPSFKYEGSPQLLEIARYRYFLVWLSSHWNDFIYYIEEIYPADQHARLKEAYAHALLKLLSKWSIIPDNDSFQLNLGLTLISDMQKALESLSKAGEKTDALHNKLVVAIEKNRIIFDRQIKKFEDES